MIAGITYIWITFLYPPPTLRTCWSERSNFCCDACANTTRRQGIDVYQRRQRPRLCDCFQNACQDRLGGNRTRHTLPVYRSETTRRPSLFRGHVQYTLTQLQCIRILHMLSAFWRRHYECKVPQNMQQHCLDAYVVGFCPGERRCGGALRVSNGRRTPPMLHLSAPRLDTSVH